MTVRQHSNDFPHRAFIEALADEHEGSPAWHTIVAGYAAVQLFESWAGGDCGSVPPSLIEIRRVRKYVEAAPESQPIRRCLLQLVESVERAAAGSSQERAIGGLEVGRVLGAYAKLLQYEGQWALAADVHQSLITFARCIDDVERLLDSMLMRGFSLRMQGELDQATAAYAALRAAATFANNERYRLESFLSDAKVAVDRGNFPVARELLDRTIADARRAGCSVVVSKGLTDRARLAAMQGDFELSLSFSYEALERSVDQMDRERILGNIALTFAQIGLRDAARETNLLIVATAQDRSVRLNATINLMEIAYQDGRETVFEQYRRELAREELPPVIHAGYHETAALGLGAFGRDGEAAVAWERLLDLAEEHGLHEYLIKAEVGLRDAVHAVPAVQSAPPAPAAEPTKRIASIARAIADMRVAAASSA